MAKRSTASLRRRSPMKKPRLRILVVTEGEKTETLYISLLVKELRATNVVVDICGEECGSDPQTVVEYARKRFIEDKTYDICFCVMDRDNHPLVRFNTALELATKSNSLRRSFSAIVSDPCIEYWFLLHFKYCRAPFTNKGQKSRAACALDSLTTELPIYAKNSLAAFEALLERTDEAISNAKRGLLDVDVTSEPNPSTNLHTMVEKFRECLTLN
jgi:hypothetical protein